LTFEGEKIISPKAAFKISNQNALLNLMSNDDLEGIKNQIHSHINKIEEANYEDDELEENRVLQHKKKLQKTTRARLFNNVFEHVAQQFCDKYFKFKVLSI